MDVPPARLAAYEPLMRLALDEAAAAGASGEVPVGAVLVDAGGELLATARNARETRQDPTAHAEMEALRAACVQTGSWRLDGCTLVVTLEPCAMCAGALVQARLATLVYGADDPKAGAVGSLWDVARDPRLPHRLEVLGGVLAEASTEQLQSFFAARRRSGKLPPGGVA
ncbi:MAG: tRNA adenosine(34) deaminase TadA [Streptosporangiales bacterium]